MLIEHCILNTNRLDTSISLRHDEGVLVATTLYMAQYFGPAIVHFCNGYSEGAPSLGVVIKEV
jgi:hypothetical protein